MLLLDSTAAKIDRWSFASAPLFGVFSRFTEAGGSAWSSDLSSPKRVSRGGAYQASSLLRGLPSSEPDQRAGGREREKARGRGASSRSRSPPSSIFFAKDKRSEHQRNITFE